MNLSTADFLRQWVPILLAIVMLGSGLVNAIAPRPIKESYERWGYPPRFNYVTATLEWLSAILIFYQPTRLFGMILAAFVFAAAIATLIRHREASHAVPAILFILVIGAWWWA